MKTPRDRWLRYLLFSFGMALLSACTPESADSSAPSAPTDTEVADLVLFNGNLVYEKE